MTGTDNNRPLAPADVRAWCGTLVAGAVVAGVVWGLLEALRRSVNEVDRSVDAVWAGGQRLARNTQTAHLLADTTRRGADLAAELARAGTNGPTSKESQ